MNEIRSKQEPTLLILLWKRYAYKENLLKDWELFTNLCTISSYTNTKKHVNVIYYVYNHYAEFTFYKPKKLVTKMFFIHFDITEMQSLE